MRCSLASLSVPVAALSAARAPGQLGDPLWVRQIGTPAYDASFAAVPGSVADVFVAGTTAGPLGGPWAGQEDCFALRCDPSGQVLWSLQFGTDDQDRVLGAAPDGQGGVFLACETRGDLAGPNAGKLDGVVARYNEGGDRIWATQFGTPEMDWPRAAASDGDGGVFVAGYSAGSLGGPLIHAWDAFVIRFDPSGQRAASAQFGTTKFDEAFAAAPDDSGGVYVAGETIGALGAPNAGGADAFVARLDHDCNVLWIIQVGTGQDDLALALAPSGDGGVYVAGDTGGGLGGPGQGELDAFVARVRADGGIDWISQLGSTASDQAGGLASDGVGGVFLTGWTGGDLGAPNAGATDIYVAQLDADGDVAALVQFGTSEHDGAFAACSGGVGGLFIAGLTYGSWEAPADEWGDVLVARLRSGCYADCDGDGDLTLFDFLAYVNAFSAGLDSAECDGDTGLTLFDFLCYVNAFNAGC